MSEPIRISVRYEPAGTEHSPHWLVVAQQGTNEEALEACYTRHEARELANRLREMYAQSRPLWGDQQAHVEQQVRIDEREGGAR